MVGESAKDPFVFDVSDNDALPLEYKRQNRDILRQFDLSDIMDNASFARLISPKESGFEKEVFNLFNGKISVFNEDVGDH